MFDRHSEALLMAAQIRAGRALLGLDRKTAAREWKVAADALKSAEAGRAERAIFLLIISQMENAGVRVTRNGVALREEPLRAVKGALAVTVRFTATTAEADRDRFPKSWLHQDAYKHQHLANLTAHHHWVPKSLHHFHELHLRPLPSDPGSVVVRVVDRSAPAATGPDRPQPGSGAPSKAERIQAVLAAARQVPDLDPGFTEDALYDENGLPA